MDFFEAVRSRRSIRKFKSDKVSPSVMEAAFRAAILAPNSSNTQTWDFFWVQDPEKKSRLVSACFSQSAARTAAELVIITADPKKWKRSQKPLIEWVQSVNAPAMVQTYYKKLIPMTYRWGFLNSLAALRWIGISVVGLFRPVPRGGGFRKEQQLIAVKSAALAAENFVLALSSQGVSSCMMEGFDEFRVKRLLKLSFSSRVVMVIAVGYEGERGTWGPQMRLPYSEVVHIV